MDYISLSQTLGGTIFIEEYRGSLVKTQSRVTAQRNTHLKSSPVENRWRSALLQAVFLIFTGNLSQAQICLEKLLDEDGLDQILDIRCRVYLFYLLALKRLAPSLRFHSLVSNSAALILDSELHLEERIKDLEHLRQKLRDLEAASPMEHFESAFFGNILTFNTACHIAFTTHPQHPPSVGTGTQSPVYPFADRTITLLGTIASPATKLYVDRLTAELLLAKGSPEAQDVLDQLKDAYDAATNLEGVANCYLIKADSIVSPPFTSPLAINLIAVLKGQGWSNDIWDTAKSNFPLLYDTRAENLYDQAMFLFEAADSPRGQAAVLLRRGCIQHAVALSASRPDKTVMNALEQARSYFSRAGKLFTGDIVNSMLVRCHQLLLATSARQIGQVDGFMGLALDPYDAAKDLGKRSHDTGNAGAAQFMGTLILRFGRWRFVERRDVRLALVCCICARLFFAAAQDSYLELQALLAHAALLHETGDFAKAETKINEGRTSGGLLESVMERVSMLCNSSGEVSALDALRFNTLKGFDIVASRIYQATGNSVMLREWMRQRDRLTPPGPGTAQQEMERLFDEFTSMTTGPGPNQILPSRVSVTNNIVQPITSQEQLLEDYNNTISRASMAMDNADVETWQASLRHFVWRCDHVARPNLQSDQIAIFKLIALSQLGALDEARQLLPDALPWHFAGPMGRNRQNVLEQFMEAYAPPDVSAWRHKQKLDAADRAISYCILAQDWTRGAEVMARVVAALPEFNTPHSLPRNSTSWQTLTFVAMIYERSTRHEEAFKWYLCALNQLEGLRNAVDVESRRGCHLSIHSGELFAGLTRICLAFANSPSLPGPPKRWGLPASSWKEQALGFLERGRSRALLDFLVVKDNLDPKKIEEWARWAYEGHLLVEVATQQGSRGSIMSYDEVAQRLGRRGESSAVKNMDHVLRALSALEAEQLAAGSIFDLAAPVLTTEPLFKCIRQDTVVFQINSSRQGLIMLALTYQGVVARHQSGLTDIELRSLVLNFSKMARQSKGAAEDKQGLEKIAAKISVEIVEPLKRMMHGKDVVVFAPPPVMQLFPCSALLLDGKPLFLSKIVYTIPSLSVLYHLSTRRPVSATANRGIINVLASSAAAGANMDPREALAEQNAIPMIGPEAAMIADIFNANPLDLAGCTTRKLRSVFAQSDIVHIATHGEAIFGSPWQSYLDTDPPFRVLDFAALTACARLVVFGCCWSGAGSANTGNDIVGFSHATLASGAQAYIGGLWGTSDVASMLLMILFYRELSYALEGKRVRLAEAWRNAQVALYHLDGPSVQVLLNETLTLWREKVQSDKTPYLRLFRYSEGVLKALLRRYNRDPTIIDFQHPAIWASYILVGYGDMIFNVPLQQALERTLEELEPSSC